MSEPSFVRLASISQARTGRTRGDATSYHKSRGARRDLIALQRCSLHPSPLPFSRSWECQLHDGFKARSIYITRVPPLFLFLGTCTVGYIDASRWRLKMTWWNNFTILLIPRYTFYIIDNNISIIYWSICINIHMCVCIHMYNTVHKSINIDKMGKMFYLHRSFQYRKF